MRQKLIHSLTQMFNEFHGNKETPNWLMEMYHQSNDNHLIQMMNNWRINYPEQYQKHGIYVM